MKQQRTPRRRGRTRWLLTTPVVGLALILIGVVLLEAQAPRVDPIDREIQDLPPLAVDDAPACRRGGDETIAQELRADIPEGGRISSSQVHRCPAAYDGLPITYVGEVIGEVLPRDGGAWAQVNDDAYALEVGPLVSHRQQRGYNSGLPVWLPDDLRQDVQEVGRAGQRGDVILVRGTLLRADPDDGGGTTVRATELEVLQPATTVEVPFHRTQALVAAVLAVLAVAAVLWSRRTRRR